MSILQHPAFGNVFFSAMMLPGLLGLFCAPFMLGLVGRKAPFASTHESPSPPSRRRRAIGALLALVVADAIVLTISQIPILPGTYFTVRGLGPAHAAGIKPNLYPLWLFFSIEVVALASVLALLLGGRGRLDPPKRSAGVKFLVVLGGLQLIPLAVGPIFDRYYLPALAPILPVLALAASSREARFVAGARAWAIGAMVVGIAIYAAGEQDYQAWNLARDTAAKHSFASAPPSLVDGGYEVNGVYTELPSYEAHGVPKRAPELDPGHLPSMVGPAHPRFRLMFVPANDPRDGVSYNSLAPGRIVIAPVP